MELSCRQRSFGMQPGFNPRLMFRFVDGRDRLAKSIALGNIFPGGFNGFNAAPLFSTLGFDLTHFIAGMMTLAVIAVYGFSR